MLAILLPSSEASSETITTKLHKIAKQDKQSVSDMYGVLDRRNTKTVCCTGMETEVLTAKPESKTQETRGNLCKLKTGIIIVEEKMKQMAYNVDHGHPSHSMILQISDSCWAKVFKSNEWQVIRDYKKSPRQKRLLKLTLSCKN
ncbi:hypothetical protein PS15p_211799 [Mucor circinelloides]